MYHELPTELFLPNRPATPGQVEYVCAQATAAPAVTAVAVAPSNVSRASNLLFGTGVGVVSSLDDPTDLVDQARLSLATGATEIALPSIALDQSAIVKNLKSFLGTTTPLTVNITAPDGGASLDDAEHALVLGANYVAYAPSESVPDAAQHMANLVALAGELQLGGVKVAGTSDHHVVVLRENAWAMTPGNSRLCIPVLTPEA